MTLASGMVRKVLPKLNAHAAFPGLCELPDGRLLHVWRDGPNHLGGTDGKIVGQHLSRDLRSWSDPFVIADWDLDLRGPSVVTLANGQVLLALFTYVTPSAPACKTWTAVSDDGGVTFSGWAEVAPDAPLLAVSGPPIELADGTQILSAYGRLTPNTYPDGAFCFRRPPGGTWQDVAATAIAYGGRDYQEPWMIKLRNGAILAAYRWGNKDSIAMCASWDGGLTWSAPAQKFAGWGQATLLEFSTGPTICIYRRIGAYPNPAVYRVSDNRGGTWGPELILDSAAKSQMSYAALVETGPGLVTGTVGREDTGTSSYLVGFHMLDTL